MAFGATQTLVVTFSNPQAMPEKQPETCGSQQRLQIVG